MTKHVRLHQREGDVQKAILAALEVRRIAAWRNNNTGVYDPRSERWRFHGQRGVADIIGVLAPSGRALFIEVKSAVGRLTTEQQRFRDTVSAAGALYVEARSVDDVLRALEGT